ncbi:MAG: MFS transporter [Candidatus Dormibacteraeota bacterium]|nr:MFS transporter [Candidatus Dormibacteraeota bacterium]
MTEETGVAEATGAPPQHLLTMRVGWFLVCAFCAMANFYLLLSVLPLDASAAGTAAAGLVTGISMLGCVATEILVAARVARLGHVPAMALGGALLALGAGLLALPGALQAVPEQVLAQPAGLPVGREVLLFLLQGRGLPLLLGASGVRGVGLAILVVAGTGIAADVAPPGRRGESLGIYGIAVSLPGAIGLPAGIWIAHRLGFESAFLLAFLFGLASVGLAFLIPRRRSGLAHAPAAFGVLRHGRVRRPALVFLTTTVAAGVYASFLPIAMSGSPAELISLALLAQTAAAAAVRWAAGRAGDRLGPRRLLVPAVLTGIAGGLLAIYIGEPVFVVVGMLLFGAGFGALQNLTLALMYEGVPERQFGGVSAVWNTAYDSGLGAGAVAFGYVSQAIGFPLGFAATAAVLGLGLFPAVRDSADRASLTL